MLFTDQGSIISSIYSENMEETPQDFNEEKTIRVSVDLPVRLVERFDELKEQWGLQRRGAVLEKLLEVVMADDGEIASDSKD